MLPSSAELEYLIEVSNVLNLSHAAKRLGMSQPSLSLAIQRLEKIVGTTLFIRHKQGMTLTQAGKQLLLHTKQLLEDWEYAKSQALASKQEVCGHYTLGFHSLISLHIASKSLSNLLETYPKLEMRLMLGDSREISEQVIKLNTDLGVVANPFKHPDLIIQKLCIDEVTFWL